MKSLFLDCNDQLAPVWQRVIRADDPPIDVNRKPFATDELPRVLDGYDIAIDDHSYMPTPLVDRCGALKHVVFLGTGPASYMNLADMAARGIKVHTIRNYGDTAVAEHAIALLLAACRDVARMDREVRAGTWVPHEGVQLFGKTLGVIGLGGIGREVLRIGRGLGMAAIAWNRSPRPGFPLVALDELLARADAISMNLTLNDETRGFLGPAQFARMKPGVIFVNTARAGSGRRDRLHRGAALGPHPPCRARRVSRRAAAAGQSARRHGKRHAHGACRLPHARSVDDAVAPRHRHRARHCGQ